MAFLGATLTRMLFPDLSEIATRRKTTRSRFHGSKHTSTDCEPPTSIGHLQPENSDGGTTGDLGQLLNDLSDLVV
jgi:hypothetical protein